MKELENYQPGQCPYCGHELAILFSHNRYCVNDDCESDFALQATTLTELEKANEANNNNSVQKSP